MKTFATLLLLITVSFSLNTQAKTSYTVSPVHKHLFMQDQWLNLKYPITEKQLAGRIIILDFWNYGCVNCLHVIPELKSLKEKYGNKLTVIGIHSGKFQNEHITSNIEKAIIKHNITDIVINDHDHKLWNTFGVNNWPTLVLIAPNGIIFSTYSGQGHKADLIKDINYLSKQYDNIEKSSLPYLVRHKKNTPLSFPSKIHFSANVQYNKRKQDLIFVSDSANHRVIALNKKAEVVLQIGSGEPGQALGSFTESSLHSPQGIAYRDGKLYIADTGNHQIKVANLRTQTVTLLAGTGQPGSNFISSATNPKNTSLSSPWDLEFFPNKNSLIIANRGSNQLLQYKINKESLKIYAGNGMEYITDGTFPFNALSQPSSLHKFKDNLYFSDTEASALRKIDADGQVTTLIGTGLFDFGFANGRANTALMQHPLGITDDGNNLLIADSYNHAIRKYSVVDSYLDAFLGGTSGNMTGPFNKAQFYEPGDIAKSNSPYIFYIADTNNHRIVKLDLTTHKLSQFYP